MEVPEDLRASRINAGAADLERPPAGRIRRAWRRFWRLVGLFLVAALIWTAWAAAAFYDFRSGLQSADPVTLDRRVDFGSLQRTLREELAADASAGGRSDRDLDAKLSRRGIFDLLRAARIDGAAGGGSEPVFGWYRILYAFYSGSPFAFRVDISQGSDKLGRPLILVFKWAGDWRLDRVFQSNAPAPAAPKTAQSPPKPAAAAAPAAAPAKPPPPGAERVVLFEEDPSDPNGKRYNGSVVWRTERAASVTGGEPQLAVIAQVSIPERPLDMSLAIRRNLDTSLPASHTIDVKFDLPANAKGGEIRDVAGIMLKPNEESAGQSLAASRVKVSKNLFLVGLSAVELDVKHNVGILKDRPWVGIPFVYDNGSRALLAIEKGKTGDKSVAEALAQWGAAAGEAKADAGKPDDGKAKKP
jgi:hypothetical protein